MASVGKKLLVRAVAWFAGIVLALGLFTLVGISLLVNAIDRLVHWGRPTDEEVSRAQRRQAAEWWAGQRKKAGGEDDNDAAAAELSGPAPVEELARLVKEAPAIVLDGECWRGGVEGGRGRGGRVVEAGARADGREKGAGGGGGLPQAAAARPPPRRAPIPSLLFLFPSGALVGAPNPAERPAGSRVRNFGAWSTN